RHWLEAEPTDTAVCVDAAPLDAAAARYFAPVADRLELAQGDVTAPEMWAQLPKDADFVVHGAAVTPHAFIDASGRQHDPEREDPVRVLTVNILGTARALDWARTLGHLRRFVYVSTGSVYADIVAGQEERPFPLPEDGYVGPYALYDVSKYSGELIARRFRQLYDLPVASVRLSSVFGPLDRPTSVRNVRNAANLVAHAAAQGHRLSVASAEAIGDYVYAPDVADALRRLLLASKEALHHDTYNIATGTTATIADLAAHAAAAAAGFSIETVGLGADVRADPARRTGRWGAYDISRAGADLGWRPRPLGDAMRAYIAWLRENPCQPT
ncbi:MAG: NAD(P)-dependent oxidoreductase, partial [Methylobacteriaceae bacterium]|nr:NAD(P)-dependent oxidoreductase [Methylobacteriaceae bacterium]